jgi:hypothetical protein
MRNSWGRTKPPLGTPIMAGHPLVRGLIGLWALNECGGTSARSASVVLGGNLSLVTGSVPWSASDIGYALSFEAGTNYYGVPDTVNSAVTLAFLVNPDTVSGTHDNQTIFSTDGYRSYFSVGGGAPNIYSTTPGAWMDGSGGVAAGVWTMVAYSQSAAGRELWAGGVLRGSSGTSANTLGAATLRFLGRRVDDLGGAPQFLGKIGMVAAWSRVLSAGEHASLAADPWAIFTPPASVVWFGEAGAPPSFKPAWASGSNVLISGAF